MKHITMLRVLVLALVMLQTTACNKSIRTLSFPCTYFEIGNKHSDKLKKERREDHDKYMSSVESQLRHNRR